MDVKTVDIAADEAVELLAIIETHFVDVKQA
jgi:hypothetical protein